jgi:class 3 adenylate cyclase/tetratricopeptide (TPR) repeat protein
MTQDISNTIDDLLLKWQEKSSQSELSTEMFLSYGVQALKLGHPYLAYDILKKGILLYPDDKDLNYQGALALARSGSLFTANELLINLINKVDESDPLFPDLLSLAGRLAKDCWAKSHNENKKSEFAQQSMSFYKKAFDITHDYYPGINAATMSLIVGQQMEARSIAQEIKNICIKENNVGHDYWLLATLGEAALILDNIEEAISWYEKVMAIIGNKVGDVASIRRQIFYLKNNVNGCDKILNLLQVPIVLAFSGHIIDTSDRTDIRFPASLEDNVRKEIDAYINQYHSIIAYSSAACGSDIIFLEAIQALKGQTHIVLPFKKQDFISSSVSIAGDEWFDRFNAVIKNATTVSYATREGYLGDIVLFAYTNDLIQGKSLLKAEQLNSDVVFLAVADKTQRKDIGGTLHSLETWENLGNKSIVIDLTELRQTSLDEKLKTSAQANKKNIKPSENDLSRQIKTMLFADCVGFSRLGEESAPSFFVNFLGQISKVIDHVKKPPVFSNTWGDGLFMVFDDVHSAAEFALSLKEMVIETDWQQHGLPNDTNIRIGMHTGPVYTTRDPIIHRDNFFGTHVNLAARIEPITTPGAIFLTEQSASMLATSGNKDFACDYLGLTDLAKKYGSDSLYRLRRAESVD